MENNQGTKRKSYNRVQKDQRDFDTLFNAEIDIEARERRQQRIKKRKKHKSNALLTAVINASRFGFSKSEKPEKLAKEAEKDQGIANSSYPHMDTTSQVPEANVTLDMPVTPVVPVVFDVPDSLPPATEVETGTRAEGSFFDKAIKRARSFYAELTDKALIAKLREDSQDSSDIFAEIKESLENTPVDAIDVQKQLEDADIQEQAQIQLEIIQEKVHFTTVTAEESSISSDPPVRFEEKQIDEQQGIVSSDNISAVVEIMFNEKDLDGQQQVEEYEQALIPEVVEAMKEIDYEHVMGVLEPRLASAVDRVDQFLDRVSQKTNQKFLTISTKIHILYRRIFKAKPENPTALAITGNKVKKAVLMGSYKILTPCRAVLNKGAATVAGAVRNASIMISSRLSKEKSDEVDKVSRLDAIYMQLAKEKSSGIVALTGIFVVSVIFGTAVYLERISAFEVFFLNSSLGIVKEKNDVLSLLPAIEENLEKETGVDVYIDAVQDFSFKEVRSRDLNILTGEQIQDKLEDINKINISAYALRIEGSTVAILTEKEQLEEILADVRDGYMADKDASEFDSVDFGEQIEIVPVQAKMMQIGDAEEVKKYLMTGTTEEKIHVVAEGETLSGIAKQYGIKTAEIIAANPNVDPTKLQINQQIGLIAPKPFITVQTKEVRTYIAEVPFDIVYEESKSLFKGETTVKSTGKPGERQVTAEIIKQNGVEISRIELESVPLKDPTNQVVVQGSKPLPLLLGTGSFQKPVRGTLSSRYGQRWSRMHQGIDIAASKGTPISAADGGTVIYAGYDGNYGNTVRINHGANKVTVYAHCSKILVKKGQKVAKGQQIATVGTTGRTTGPHLHFEVRINDKVVNPLEYVKY